MEQCESLLQRVVRAIEPTEAQKRGAARSHTHLRGVLDTGQMANRITGSYLTGSYLRDTAISPLDDVDCVFTIDPSRWAIGLLDERPEPEAVLSSFARAIRRRYAESAVWLQRRSVRLELAHVHIDVVPAVPSGTSKDMILLPDRQKGSWITSAPKIHAALSTSVNAQNGGLFKPVVKLLKAWNGSLPANARFKSFAVETMATRIFSTVTINSLCDGCVLFLDFVASLDGQGEEYEWKSSFGMTLDWTDKVIPDTAGTGSNLASSVSDDRLAGFISGAVQGRTRLLHARRAHSAEKASDWLRKVFGVDPSCT